METGSPAKPEVHTESLNGLETNTADGENAEASAESAPPSPLVHSGAAESAPTSVAPGLQVYNDERLAMLTRSKYPKRQR